MAESKQARFLREYGDKLIDQGYNITPIQVGEKYPPHEGWSQIKATKAKLKSWLEDGITYETKDRKTGKTKEVTADVSRAGVGIITKNTPGVDIDVSDDEMALALEEFVHERFGMAPVRVGRAPRRLLLFRCDAPFHKVQSSVWVDQFDEEQKVEILADGQQFVAFHIHPKTGKPYQWLYKDGPHLTAADDLPVLTEDDAREIVKEFERRAHDAGWKKKKSARENPKLKKKGAVDEDDPFADVKAKTVITDAELRDLLFTIPDNEDHDTWFQIGMALYHQYDGSAEGLELWHDWSESAHNYDRSALDKRWESFDINEKGREPLTARYIIKLAQEHKQEEAREEAEAIITMLKEADNKGKFESACKSAKTTDLDKLTHEMVLQEVKVAYRRITGHTIQVKTARDLIRYENPRYAKEKPEWLNGWVYIESSDSFFNTETQAELSHNAFNSAHNRYLLTKAERMEGKARPETQADDAALNVYEIELVRGKMYLPDADIIFTLNGVRYVNSYTDRSVPDFPKKTTEKDKEAVALVEGHFNHLIADERDRSLVISWLSHIARTRKRPNWAVMIQGPEGDGKSTLGLLMAHVCGPENVKVISPNTIEKSEFTSWSQGAILGVIEEMKLHGHNRFDVMNTLKDKITNDTIPIHAKGKDELNAINTMAYLIFTNYKDAMPITKASTRHFPIFSRMKTPEDVDEFNLYNPLYFTELRRAIQNHPGAIRRWLVEYESHPDFDPHRRAEKSSARAEMIRLSRTEEEEVLDDLLGAREREDHSETLLNATSVSEAVSGIAGVVIGAVEKRIRDVLLERGFTYLGRFRDESGERARYWSRTPERFYSGTGKNRKPDGKLIRDWVSDL